MADPLKRLAVVLIRRAGGRCENYTACNEGQAWRGARLGYCFASQNRRRVLAKYSADEACPACLAHRALKLSKTKRER